MKTIRTAICIFLLFGLCSCADRGPMSTSTMRFLCMSQPNEFQEEFVSRTLCRAASNALENGNFTTAEQCIDTCYTALDEKAGMDRGIDLARATANAQAACSLYCRRNYP